MGTSHSFECEQCHKNVIASLVETDGMHIKVKAMLCNSCNNISDCVTEEKNLMDTEFRSITPKCEVCQSEDLTLWDGNCPKCRDVMVDNGAYIYWD